MNHPRGEHPTRQPVTAPTGDEGAGTPRRRYENVRAVAARFGISTGTMRDLEVVGGVFVPAIKGLAGGALIGRGGRAVGRKIVLYRDDQIELIEMVFLKRLPLELANLRWELAQREPPR